MIVETLDHAERYHAVHPGVAAGLRALRDPALLAREDGRYPLDGDRLVAIAQRYRTRPAIECVWEAHRRYIDVQCVLEGVEAMGWLALSSAQPRCDHDPEKDVRFFHPPGDRSSASLLVVRAGSFAVFFPQDVHCPCVAVGGVPAAVRKVVIKVAMDW